MQMLFLLAGAALSKVASSRNRDSARGLLFFKVAPPALSLGKALVEASSRLKGSFSPFFSSINACAFFGRFTESPKALCRGAAHKDQHQAYPNDLLSPGLWSTS